jgi:hypothetical protein
LDRLLTFRNFFAMTLSRLMKVSNNRRVSKLGGSPPAADERGLTLIIDAGVISPTPR